jgi:4-amino-4-deoxy-L-arabinose transferase-like glycosyltransferase
VRRPAGVAAIALGLAALHVVWLARFRWGYVLDYDEASYLAAAVQMRDGLLDGPAAYLDAVRAAGAQPPLVPTSAFPLLALFGRDVDAALATGALWSILLVVSTYGVARRLVSHRWALLAALAVGTAPIAVDYSRMFHFAVPAAVLLTASLYAVLRSDGLRAVRWVVAAGVLLGLMTVARTMTVAYVPGVVAGAALALLLDRDGRRRRARNLALGCAAGAAVAALWWVPAWDSVWPYLRGTGYGAEAAAYGTRHDVLSARFWTADLEGVAVRLQLPLAAALALCLLAGVPRLRAALLRPEPLLLACVVAGGYLALASTPNAGSAFELPWLPALVVLAVAGAAGAGRRPVRVALAAVLAAVCAFNLLLKNGVDESLSRPRVIFSHRLGVVHGLDRIEARVASEYAVTVPPQRLPALHRRWAALDEALARFVVDRVPAPSVGVATRDWFVSESRLHLASVVRLRRSFPYGLVRSPAELAGRNVLITSDPPRRPLYPLDERALEAAARAAGFRVARTFRAPDGRRVLVWLAGGRGAPRGA